MFDTDRMLNKDEKMHLLDTKKEKGENATLWGSLINSFVCKTRQDLVFRGKLQLKLNLSN